MNIQQLLPKKSIKPVAQHKTIRDSIPKEWMDLDGILENVLTAIIISFVEEENGLSPLEYIKDLEKSSDEKIIDSIGGLKEFEEYKKKNITRYTKLKEIYHWVKVTKPSKEKYIKALKNKEVNQESITKLEEEMKTLDTKHFKELVELRETLWT